MMATKFNPMGLYAHTFTRREHYYACDECDIRIPLSESTYHQLTFATMDNPHNERNMALLREKFISLPLTL